VRRWLMRWAQAVMERRLRRSGGRFQGMDVLFLHTEGRRSGAPRRTAVSWFPDGADAWLVVASAGGAARNPDWYANLVAHPERAGVEFPDRPGTLAVAAEPLSGEARRRAWDRIAAEHPRYARYQRRTDREIPVVRLVRASSGG
jgi:deazaflavin-dependent oxidoreductase (nitroreductase family)